MKGIKLSTCLLNGDWLKELLLFLYKNKYNFDMLPSRKYENIEQPEGSRKVP